ncbi:MAG TPA: hypothetical protein VK644_03630, partial [Chitinophagaceae bacterium]|nr:hypothetical protein [Chitinophagaceae bacterium]
MVVLMTLAAKAQLPAFNGSNLRKKVLRVDGDSLRIDTSSIIPKTFVIEGIPAIDYRLDFINGILFWNKRPTTESVQVQYRVFSYKLNPVAQRMKYDSVMNNMSLTPYEFNSGLSDVDKGIFNFGTMKAEGSFGRQIAFGNSQDAV